MATTVINLSEVSIDRLHDEIIAHRNASMTSYLLHRQRDLNKAKVNHCVNQYCHCVTNQITRETLDELDPSKPKKPS